MKKRGNRVTGGNRVKIAPCKPLSPRKHWKGNRVTGILMILIMCERYLRYYTLYYTHSISVAMLNRSILPVTLLPFEKSQCLCGFNGLQGVFFTCYLPVTTCY